MSDTARQSAASSRAPVAADYLCTQCGYNLRGLIEDRCPECGTGFDRTTLSDGRIPWMHRHSRGRLRAYWATVRMVSLRPRQLAQEMSRPVPYADAQRFRWLTILHAWLPSLLATVIYLIDGSRVPLVRDTQWAFEDGWLIFAFHASLLAALAVATGVPSYLFHPRSLPVEQQNRAIALSYYAAAPLAWTPVLFGLVWLVVSRATGSEAVARTAITVLMLLPWLLWWRCLIVLARHGLGQRAGRTALIAFGVPVLWIVLGGLTLFGVELLVKYAGLLYFSLQG